MNKRNLMLAGILPLTLSVCLLTLCGRAADGPQTIRPGRKMGG